MTLFELRDVIEDIIADIGGDIEVCDTLLGCLLTQYS